MSEAHRIAVNVVLSSNHVGVLGALSSQLLHVHGQVGKLHEGWNRLKTAMAGGLAIAGGVATLSVLGKMVDRGNELVKLQQNMAAAGVKAAEVQEAVAKAWQLTGKYQNVSAAEALKVISEARMTFGSQHEATHHSEDFIKMISFLKAFQGGKHGGGAADFEREAIAAMKSGEIAGKITPTDMAEHVKQLTAMRVAYGDQLNIQQYLTAQRAGGVALRNTSDSFRYGMFPALVQENGSNAGVMLMTAFNKVVAGTGNRTKSVEHMAELGLLDKKHIEYGKDGHVKGLKDPSAILNNKEAAMNFGDWVQNTLRPLLDKRLDKEGLQGNDRAIRESQLISAMFPDRNAAKAITEILQQYSKLSKDAHLMAEARKALNESGYLDKSWEGQKQAFVTQWENLMDALGAPMVGEAAETLKAFNQSLSGVAQWAAKKENAEAVASIFRGLAIGAAALTGAGAAALLAAIGPAGWLVGGIIGLVGSWATIDPSGFKATMMALKDMAAYAYRSVRDFVTDPATVAAAKVFWTAARDTATSIYTSVKAAVTDPQVLHDLREFFKRTKDEVVWLRDFIKWGTKDQTGDKKDLDPIKRFLMSFKAIENMLNGKDGDPMGRFVTGLKADLQRLDAAFNEMALDFGRWLKSLKPSLDGWDKMFNDAALAVGNEIKSWPGKLAEAISSMGSAIVAKIKETLSSLGGILSNPGNVPPIGQPMSFGGGGGGLGGLIHNASYGGGGRGGANVGALAIGSGTGVGHTASQAERAAYIKSRAASLGIDPNVALRVAQSEGFGRFVGDFGTSFGDFQLHYGGSGIRGMNSMGEGDLFTRATGLSAKDPKNWKAATDWALKRARQNGWGAWHGAARVGIGNRQGIGTHPVTPMPEMKERPAPPTAPPPPRVPHIIQARHDIHLDGRKVASSVSRHMAENARFPRHVGGMDTHGSYRTPGTRLTDAA